MKYSQLLTFLLAMTFVSTAYASVNSYFNHNQNASYTDPYRRISRPGDNLEAVIISEIKKAKDSVFIAIQELRLPLIAQALIDKHNEGVDVRVILENNYNWDVRNPKKPSGEGEDDYEVSRSQELIALVDINKNGRIERSEQEQRDAVYMLRKAKIHVIDDSFGSTAGSALMHHKFLVIDDRTTIISTANFTMSCIHGDILTNGSRGNPNSLIVVESPSLADVFTEEFTQMWGNGKIGNFGLRKTFRGARTVNVRGAKITVQFSPTSKTHGWENSVNGLIGETLKKSTKSVKAALFVFSDQELSNILEKRHERGVDMGFIVETKFAYREYSELLDMMGLELIGPAPGCRRQSSNQPWKKPITEGGMSGSSNGDILHHKFAVVDERKVIMGSHNWTASANHQNDEALIVVENSRISDSYSREYNRIKSKTVMGPPAYLLAEINERRKECSRRQY